MLRQTFGLNPATGRVEHHYVDCGPVKVDRTRGGTLASSTQKYGGDNVGRKRGVGA